MHYCQSCDTPVVMEPRDGHAACPECGRLDDAVLGPLFIVTGASCSGKTAVLAPLARRLQGRCITFDADLLLDSAGALNGGQPITWTAFLDAWLAVAHGVAQSGMPTVLLGPFIPDHLRDLPARRRTGDIRFFALDCPDDLRRARINARPRWRSRDTEEQVEFGQWLRRNIPDRFDTSNGTPEDTAAAISAWIDRRAGAPENVISGRTGSSGPLPGRRRPRTRPVARAEPVARGHQHAQFPVAAAVGGDVARPSRPARGSPPSGPPRTRPGRRRGGWPGSPRRW